MLKMEFVGKVAGIVSHSLQIKYFIIIKRFSYKLYKFCKISLIVKLFIGKEFFKENVKVVYCPIQWLQPHGPLAKHETAF